MRVYHFSEQPYPDAWEKHDVLRNIIPSSACDPREAADILNHRLDEWMLCDELGINIMVNEHHATATCLSVSCTLTLAILARQTQNVRLLGLGIPLANRLDPVRVAEEIAYIDVVSRGRLDVGLVKGGPGEIPLANSKPTRFMDHFWDSHDLILKALTTRTGPFSWETEFNQFRQVNVWPPPYQSPHPPIWITGVSTGTAAIVGERGHIFASFLGGGSTVKLHDAYKARAIELGRPQPGPDRFAYMGIMGVGSTREEGLRRADEILGYVRTTRRSPTALLNPPGYMDINGNVRWLREGAGGRSAVPLPATTREGRVVDQYTASPEDLIQAYIVFAGTPDDVYDQIIEFNKMVGGVETFIIMGHGGAMSHKEAAANLSLFGKEVLPRLKEYDVNQDVREMKATTAPDDLRRAARTIF